MPGAEAPDPRRARTSGELVEMLRALKTSAGLSYREIEQRARDAGDWLPASTLATVLGRTTAPRAEVVEALVQACGGDPETVSVWVDATRRLSGEPGTDGGFADHRGDPPPPAVVVPRQLPGDLGTFVGRTKTIETLDGLLDRAVAEAEPTAPPPIIALVGPGGIGKTALAVRWAHAISGRFPDGQLFADLKGFSDTAPVTPSLVLHRFLRALGTTADDIPTDLDERVSLYRSLLAGRKVAIVLDNVRDAAQVRPLLPGAATCLVVVTSRVELRGLAVSHDLHPVMVDGLSLDEGVQLLVRLLGAQRVRAEAGAAVDLVELCRTLPLALRLAAAQLAVDERRSIAHFAARVRDAGRLSTLSVPDDPDTALRTTFDLSYATLAPEAQRLLRLTGSHPGPDMSLGSLAALAARDETSTRTHMEALATLHMVGRAGSDRWEFHDLVREYVTGHLGATETGEQKRLLRGLLDWYTGMTGSAIWKIAPRGLATDAAVDKTVFPDYADALAWLDEESTGIVAAVIAAERADLSSYVFTLAGLLWRYFLLRSQYEQLNATADLALDMAHRLGDVAAQTQFSLLKGNAYSSRCDPARAIEYYERAHTLARHAGDRDQESYALANGGTALIDLGRYVEARERITEAMAIFTEHGDVVSTAGAHSDLGKIDLAEGDHSSAFGRFERSLELFEEAGQRHGVAVALFFLGATQLEQGEVISATLRLEQALAASTDAGFTFGEALVHSRLALAAAMTGAFDTARDHHTQAVEFARRIHDPVLLAEIYIDAGRAGMIENEPERAAGYFRNALTNAERSSDAGLTKRSQEGVRAAERAIGFTRPLGSL
ncbi:tetratricopeptide repeat protein [Phytomonospora sp. NPDC050363]|uniref:ATP-binding protein n=1 Tax=Phytomonospora sp. NPDC050363 TaxID=3155642 RepID=UPI0033D08BCB